MKSFGWLYETLLQALRLEDKVFVELRDSPDGFRQGLTFIVTLALVVGLIVAAAGFVVEVSTDPTAEVEQAMSEVEEAFEQMSGMFGDDEQTQQMLENIKAGMSMGTELVRVVEETTPAPMSIALLFQAIGRWLSRPFSWIALWLLWGILTLLFARLMGGTATIQQMLAATSLAAAPHILEALSWVPCAGPLVAILAFLWGAVIYIKATAVANRLTMGPATVAALLPLSVPLVLVVGFVLVIAFLAAFVG